MPRVHIELGILANMHQPHTTPFEYGKNIGPFVKEVTASLCHTGAWARANTVALEG